MNWLKKKIQKLSEKLNADEDTQSVIPLTETSSKAASNMDNIEALKEIVLGAIAKAIKMLGYSNAVVSGIAFHSRFADNAVENVGLQFLVKDEDFQKHIKRTFKSKAVQYKDDLLIELLLGSQVADRVTHIVDGIGVEILTPNEMLRKIKGKIVTTEGITWEPEYILEPSDKTYFIGRCKSPKIENGPKIQNDIAFVGIEEKNEEQYKVNNYVSRSHAYIMYDKDAGAFKIYRSKFLNNPSHKIKIYNTRLNDFSGVNLTQSTVPHTLRNGDSICLNDKAVLEFSLIDGFSQL